MWCSMSSTSRRCRAAIFFHSMVLALTKLEALVFWFWVQFRFTLGSEKKTVALGSGSYWLSMKCRMLSSVPSLVTRSCLYLSSCCSTEVMLSSIFK